MSKGSRPRKYSVPLKEFDKNYEGIFGKKPPKEQYVPPPLPGDNLPKDSTQGG
jgi:hypothetical protein